MNWVDVRLVRGRLMIGHLEAHVVVLLCVIPCRCVVGLGLARVRGQRDVALKL